jgi:hypothetical protein
MGNNLANEPLVEGTIVDSAKVIVDGVFIHVDNANLNLKVEYMNKMIVAQMRTIKLITKQLCSVQDSTAKKPKCCQLSYVKV